MNLSNIHAIRSLPKVRLSAGIVYWLILLSALTAFEFFNYSTTEFALRDLMGDLKFMGMHWATILALAFCGIDFAGIARLFSPDQSGVEQKEVWYLFGAWMLAATMNAMLTWWGISVAVTTHAIQGSSVMSADLLIKVVPLFVAVMVWVIRILMIGSISVMGSRLQGAPSNRPAVRRQPVIEGNKAPFTRPVTSTPVSPRPVSAHPGTQTAMTSRPEPTYHNVGAYSARPPGSSGQSRKL